MAPIPLTIIGVCPASPARRAVHRHLDDRHDRAGRIIVRNSICGGFHQRAGARRMDFRTVIQPGDPTKRCADGAAA